MSEPGGWPDRAVGYEVYLRSFQDSNGDGIGDLAGITARLDYLAWLGVDVIWVTPFYPSPQADFGYDVSDYCAVDADYGSLADFDALVAAAHSLGLRVMVDIVPNHTSDQHPWFAAALASREDPLREYYVWRDPAADGGPPNNWVSHFGGPAWTFDDASGQYYMHLFLPEQPDLNWANESVRKEFDGVLRFWLDRGVDGFRIDVAHSLLEDEQFRDNPQIRPFEDGDPPRQRFWSFDHVHDLDQPDVVDIYRRWRAIADEYGAVLLGEVYLTDPVKVARYLSEDTLGLAFYFATMRMPWTSTAIRDVMSGALAARDGGWTWVQCSHDETRSAQRFGGGDLGRERALTLSVLFAGLPGAMFLYQGEELGLLDGVVAAERAADPVGTRNADSSDSRDGCRTPMPWAPGKGWGFTTAAEPWLPFGGRTAADTAEVQRAADSSWVHSYRRLVAARHDLPSGDGDAVMLAAEAGDPVVAFRHGPVITVANIGDEPAELVLPDGRWRVRYHAAGAENDGLLLRGSLNLQSRDAYLLADESGETG